MSQLLGGKVITFASAKGGVGKTTLISNLAGAYYLLGQRTLILDLDVDYGSIALFFNTIPIKTLEDYITDVNEEKQIRFKDYVTQYNEGIDFVAASKDPRVGNMLSIELIKGLIDYAKDNYDVVLIDTSHANQTAKLGAIDLSDLTIQVVTTDLAALKNTKSILTIVNELNYKATTHVLVNEALGARNNYSMNELETILGYEVSYVLPTYTNIPNQDSYVLKGTPYILAKSFKTNGRNLYSTILKLAKILINADEQSFSFKQKAGFFRLVGSRTKLDDLNQTQKELKEIAANMTQDKQEG